MNKKTLILENTLFFLAKCGVDGLKLDEIAKKSDIKTSSIYSFFKNREDLIIQTTDWAKNEYSLNHLSININQNISSLLQDIYTHYIELFSVEKLKNYYIFLLKEAINNKKIAKLYEGLMYEIETEVAFVLGEKYEKYSTVIYHTFPSIFFTLFTEGKKEALWYAERIIESFRFKR